jgi:tetratricopeptide (TPR) repeat protein
MDDSQSTVPAPKPEDLDATRPNNLSPVPPSAPADLEATQPILRPAAPQVPPPDPDLTQATRPVPKPGGPQLDPPLDPDGSEGGAEATRRYTAWLSEGLPAGPLQNSDLKRSPDGQEPAQVPAEKPVRKKIHRWPWILLGIVFVLVGGAVGGWNGYQEAVHERMLAFTSQIAIKTATQYQLGLDDMAAKRYTLARSRFEYVISLDPVFPGAAEKLAEAMLAMGMIATPTPEPTLTSIPATPTPDMRGEEEIFSQIQALMAAKKWSDAMAAMDTLREKNLTYRAVDVDGMYYLALRNEGVQQILVEGNLEPGIYNLALAERFAPLDADADSYRTYARLYLTGASFWKLDWGQVLTYFGDIYLNLPNLRDASNMTAQERFRIASTSYGDQLVSEGKPCDALSHYKDALSLSKENNLEPTATKAAEECEKSKNPPTATLGPVELTPTPTVTVTPGGIIVPPTETATNPPPAVDTETPTPTATQPPPAADPTHTMTVAPPPAGR